MILLIPAVIPSTLIFVLWKWMYNYQSGPINHLLVDTFGLFTVQNAPQWLGGTALTLPAIAIMEVWWGLGYHTIFFIAGLAAIPKELPDAARIDGANEWQVFWHVTRPQLAPIMMILVVLRFGSAMAVIDEYLIFGGFNRASPTYTWTIFMYDQAFKTGLWRQGYARRHRHDRRGRDDVRHGRAHLDLPSERLRMTLEADHADFNRHCETSPLVGRNRGASPRRDQPLQSHHPAAARLGAASCRSSRCPTRCAAISGRSASISPTIASSFNASRRCRSICSTASMSRPRPFSSRRPAPCLRVMRWCTSRPLGSGLVVTALLVSLYFPVRVVSIISIYETQHWLGLINNTSGLILPYVTLQLAISILIMRSMFQLVPHEMFESARIDGAGHWRALWEIGLPMVRNGLVVIFIVNFVAAWGEYLLCLTLVDDEAKRTMPVVLAAAQGGQGQWAWPNLAAVYVIVVTPGIIAFTLAQRLFFKGLMEGALKG